MFFVFIFVEPLSFIFLTNIYDKKVNINIRICTIIPGLPKYQLAVNEKLSIAQFFNGSSKSTGAIEIIDGVAVVDKDKCVSCGKCVSTCPKHIIELLPAKKKVKVECSSKDNGKGVMAVCSAGCIACKICEKNCPFDAIHVVDNLAVIDYDKCKACGICANKCPKGVITGKKPAPAKAEAKQEEAKTEESKQEQTKSE